MNENNERADDRHRGSLPHITRAIALVQGLRNQPCSLTGCTRRAVSVIEEKRLVCANCAARHTRRAEIKRQFGAWPNTLTRALRLDDSMHPVKR